VNLEQDIVNYLSTLLPPNFMPSHDLAHHQRVLRNAKKIIQYSDLFKNMNESVISQLTFACLFHDIGMLTDAGPIHGTLSKTIATEYVKTRKLAYSDFQLALDAIEKHDDKSYNYFSNRNSVLTLLSIADDMDAFGLLGAYRYAEIYLTRGISISNLSKKVIENSSQRLKHCHENLGDSIIYDIMFLDHKVLCSLYENNFHSNTTFFTFVELLEQLIKSDNQFSFEQLLKEFSSVHPNNYIVSGLKKEYYSY